MSIFVIFPFFENRVLGIEAYFTFIIAANALLKSKRKNKSVSRTLIS